MITGGNVAVCFPADATCPGHDINRFGYTLTSLASAHVKDAEATKLDTLTARRTISESISGLQMALL